MEVVSCLYNSYDLLHKAILLKYFSFYDNLYELFVYESLFFFGFTILLYVATKYIATVIGDNEPADNNHN